MATFFKGQTIDLHPANLASDKLQQAVITGVSDEALTIRSLNGREDLIEYPIGTALQIYFVRPDAIYSMNTRVVDKILKPVPLLILHRDDQQISRIQRRQFFRVAVKVKVIFKFNEEADGTPPLVETSYTRNLSAGGLYCPIHSPCAIGDQLIIQIFIPQEADPVEAVGKIVRIHPPAKKNQPQFVGFAFVDIKESCRARLTRFLFRVQARKKV